MRLSELRQHLSTMQSVSFQLPGGKLVPAHFHVTELGVQTKNFIDCGGTIRTESRAVFQLWTSIDFHHRLKADKLTMIMDMAESRLELGDLEIDVEFQGDRTIEVFSLEHSKDGLFQLSPKQTACLAEDACGIVGAAKSSFTNLAEKAQAGCTPGGGCC